MRVFISKYELKIKNLKNIYIIYIYFYIYCDMDGVTGGGVA
jgi:hypothetical protein